MGFFDLFKPVDINQGVKEYSSTPGAVLLDVRTSEEYRGGHIPGSKNVPLQAIDKVASVADNKIPCCLSTATPAAAVVRLSACCSIWDILM